MIYTTLNAIRVHRPCASGWEKLLAHLGKIKADDEPLSLETILDSNGLDDALWCLRALGPEHHGWIRHYACDCAEDVAHLLTDARSYEAIRMARRYADGDASEADLAAARAAAWVAADAAARAAAWVAADAAARAAAWAPAWAAAWVAAWVAARAAAWAPGWVAAWAAAEVPAEAPARAAEEAAAIKRQADRLREYLRAGGRPK